MINFSIDQLDALAEVFNIGAGRAASSLSEIVGSDVKLSVPRVEFFKSSEINASALNLTSNRIGAVRQHFSGSIEAEVMLLFTEERALNIVREMMGSDASIEELAEYEQEAMCELGNIILNACISAIADILGVTLDTTLPIYSVDSTELILSQIVSDAGQPVMLVLHINMTIEKHDSQGNLAFILSSTSLKELIVHIDRHIQGI